MRRFWARMALVLGRNANVVAIAAGIVTVILTAGTLRLEFATGQDSYLNKDDQVAKDNVEYQNLYGGQSMLTLFKVDDSVVQTLPNPAAGVFTPRNVQQFEQLTRELGAAPAILEVVTPLTALEFTNNLIFGTTDQAGNRIPGPALVVVPRAAARETDPQGQAARAQASGETLRRSAIALNVLAQRLPEFRNPDGTPRPPANHDEFLRAVTVDAFANFLLNDNSQHTRDALLAFFPRDAQGRENRFMNMVVRLEGNQDIEAEGAAATLIKERVDALTWEGMQATTTGAPILLKDINDYLRGGMVQLGGLAVVIMVGILAVAFAVRWRLLSLAVVLVGTVWAFGAAGYLGIPLTVVTISGLPVLLGVGIDFAIQLHSRIEEEVALDRADHPIQETTVNLVPPVIVATLAAALAFLCLQFSQVPMIRDFGKLLAVGIVVIVIADVILTTAALGYREYYKPTAPADYTHGPLGRFVLKIGSLPHRLAPPLIIASVLVFAAGALIEGRLTLQTDPEKWVNQDSQVVQDVRYIRENTGSTSELSVFLRADDVFTDDAQAFADAFSKKQLERFGPGGTVADSRLLTVSSITQTVASALEVPDETGDQRAGVPIIRPTGEDARAFFAVAPAPIRPLIVADGGASMNITFRTGPNTLEELKEVVDLIREDPGVPQPVGVTATPSGLAVVGTGLLENLEANRVELTYLAMAVVFVFLLIRLRSIAQAILCMVPVSIAVGAASLVAFASGIELSPLTALGGPLVIAACTEFTVLIMMRHLEERVRGHEPKEAVDLAAARTGRAFVVSALTAITGVIVLAFSSLPLLRDFGLIAGLNVALALLAALTILPPLIIWADEKGWVHRHDSADDVIIRSEREVAYDHTAEPEPVAASTAAPAPSAGAGASRPRQSSGARKPAPSPAATSRPSPRSGEVSPRPGRRA